MVLSRIDLVARDLVAAGLIAADDVAD